MEQLQATTSTYSADAAGIADCQEPSEPAMKKPRIDGDEWSSGRGDPDRGTSRDPGCDYCHATSWTSWHMLFRAGEDYDPAKVSIRAAD